MTLSVKCATCGFRNYVSEDDEVVVRQVTDCRWCGRRLAEAGVSQAVAQCSVFVPSEAHRTNIQCPRPVVEGSDLCAEHVAAREAECQMRERVAAELREKLAGKSANKQLIEELQ